jgi:hypothetical protein
MGNVKRPAGDSGIVNPQWRADVLAQRLVDGLVERHAVQNPAAILVYGKYRPLVSDVIQSLFGPVKGASR